MKTKERYSVKNQFSFFPQEEVIEIGDKIESILSKEKINTEDRKLLEYLETYLLFRINIPKGDNNPYTESLNEAREKLNLPQKEFHILNFWARGSRRNEQESLSETETKILYEKVREKLE
jgi:hypothetical protein